MSGTFDADVLGFMVYDDGDRLPLGHPNHVTLREIKFTLYWAEKWVPHDGLAIAIALVTPSGAVSLSAIDPLVVQRGQLFHGSISIYLADMLEWRDMRAIAA